MITSKDIHKKKFEKVKFGYSPEEVDAFLAQLETDVKLMEQELTDTNDKVQILADKVREYKETEEDLKNALIGAQKQAREVIAQANGRAEEIEQQARERVDSVQAQTKASLETEITELSEKVKLENAALVMAQRQVSAFKKALFDMYKEHLAQISRLPESMDDLPEDVLEELERQSVAEPEPEPETEPEPEAPAEEEQPEEEPQESAEPEEAEEEEIADPFAESGRRGYSRDTNSFGSRRDDKKKRY